MRERLVGSLTPKSCSLANVAASWEKWSMDLNTTHAHTHSKSNPKTSDLLSRCQTARRRKAWPAWGCPWRTGRWRAPRGSGKTTCYFQTHAWPPSVWTPETRWGRNPGNKGWHRITAEPAVYIPLWPNESSRGAQCAKRAPMRGAKNHCSLFEHFYRCKDSLKF